jgi:cellulose synthase/poly-beta-1,6-N-acetylglucosamine synthase-like glycosyltransferase
LCSNGILMLHCAQSAESHAADGRLLTDGLTVIVPAYNEAASIVDTVRSIQAQTLPVTEIIVIDDFSTDNTGELARSCGVTVLRPPANTGSKAGAQNFALTQVRTEYTMAIDADTTLAPDAIERLMKALDDPGIAAACGFVIPRHVRSIWERGRYIEYMFAFTFYKCIQDYYEKPLISSGCFSVYRTDILRENGGWSTRTMAEDMDLTWSFYQAGHGVRFVPGAVCYPIEPQNYHYMSKQLRRWSHGFVQNVRLHWRGLLEVPFLRMVVAVALWDATIASFAYIFLLPLLAVFVSPWFLLAYLIDLPAVAVPVLYKGLRRGELMRTITSLPGFFVLRIVNSVFLLKALWMELVVNQSLTVYEKGH